MIQLYVDPAMGNGSSTTENFRPKKIEIADSALSVAEKETAMA
jgi:hypothetical protein